MAKKPMGTYREFVVSADGKSVTVDGKKYKVNAFLKEFDSIETRVKGKSLYGMDAIRPNAVGSAIHDVNAPNLRAVRGKPGVFVEKPKAGSTRIGTMGRGGGLGGPLGKLPK